MYTRQKHFNKNATPAGNTAGRVRVINGFMSMLHRAASTISHYMRNLWRSAWRLYDRLEKAVLLVLPKALGRFLYRLRPKRRKHPALTRLGYGVTVLLMFATITPGVSQYIYHHQTVYALSPEAQHLLGEAAVSYADRLKLNDKQNSYTFNAGYQPGLGVGGQVAGPKYSAELSRDPSEGVTVTDVVNSISVTFRPKFGVQEPKMQGDRMVYPLTGSTAQKVYTMRATSIKEDVILNHPTKDTLEYTYDLVLANGTEARLLEDGGLGIFGVDTTLLGNVSSGTDQDAKLLEDARKNGEKNTLLFRFPAPFVREYGKKSSNARAWFSLKGTELTVHASNLLSASYPLSIDPTVYIETARKLMRGNNESNIDFDIDNQLIEKGKTTGGRFDSWVTNSMALPAARWNHASAAAGGYVYVMGGHNGTAAQGNLYWAQFSSLTGAIESAYPSGTDTTACTNWCTSSAYDLPSGAVRTGASMVAYNGYLYLIGGLDSGGTRTNTVYIAKIGANGEPQLWHPSDSNKNNWVYWYQDTTLSSARSYHTAVAYNNRLYVVGGSTTASSGGITTVEKADISPTGVLTNWGTVTELPSARYSMGVQVYNDRLYVIGGANGTTTQNTVYYTKINNDGSLNSWLTGISINNGASGGTRASLGGTMTTVWGGYIYVAGGCTTMNASGYCTAIASDIQLASINADGSITDWTTILGVTSTRMGYGFVSWRNRLYGIGGCAAQNTTTGACTTVNSSVQYGDINPDGDVSTVSTSVANGTSPCVTTAWIDCDLPPEGDSNGQSGRMSGAAIINNGFIYYLGGCTAVNSGSVCYTGNAGKSSDNVAYASIASDGNITRVTSCAGTFSGSWCVINPGLGAAISAFGYAVFNNTMYVIGGTTGTQWQPTVWRSSFNDNGTWGAWTSQTFAATGLGNAKGYMFAFTRANPSQASTYPGNLYVLGGCSGVTAAEDGLDCSGNMYTEVYKCFIKTDGSIETTGSPCTTTGQLQIDSETTAGNQGLGVMAGTVYANYIYLIGGQSPNQAERGAVMYAKIDNSNNIVATSGSTWTTSPYSIDPVRRRGIAFGYNGYLYALAGYNVSQGGSLNDLLYAKINVSDGSIGPFDTSSVTVSARWDLRGVVNNGYVYAIGGCSIGAPPASCTTMTGTVQTFQLYNNYSGSPKLYNAGSQFGTDRYGASSTVSNGYIYVAGGCTTAATDCTTATNSVQYAPINADGTIGTWSAAANLPASLAWGQLEAVGGSLYYIGGQIGGSNNGTSSVYYGTPSSGNISSWGTATNGLPAGRSQHGGAVWNDRIYVVGGNDASGAATNTVYVSPQLSSGGNITSAWDSASTSFGVARSGAAVIAYANNLYVLGGFTGTYYLNDVQYSQISTSNGRAGAWSYSTSLPATLRQADGFAANGFMYLFGGRTNATTCRSNTIVAPISANTTIASGNNPTGIGDWYATNIRYTGDRYGAAAVYYDGKAYVMGGQCNGTMITTTNKAQYSTLQSQPQLARYSIMIDTDTDVFPNSWLMNGLDNSIGARWYMRYRSMTDIDGVTSDCVADMTTWGQEYYHGIVTLGNVGTLVPRDGSGTNTNCARYYYLSVNIDSSQAYGYPEDVTRGPTITDLSLFYTADPSKRMLHGKTFTGGEQQPLDTPCRRGSAVLGDPNYNCPLP